MNATLSPEVIGAPSAKIWLGDDGLVRCEITAPEAHINNIPQCTHTPDQTDRCLYGVGTLL